MRHLTLEKVLAIAGSMLVVLVTIALLNTYTDLFKDSFEEEEQASVEEKPLLEAKPKEGQWDHSQEGAEGNAPTASTAGDEQKPTPALKFVQEVHKEYPELLKVRADFEQGGKCSAQLLLDAPTLAQWRSNQNRLVRAMTSVRDKATQYSRSAKCVVDVVLGENTVIRASPQGGQTKVTLFKIPNEKKA